MVEGVELDAHTVPQALRYFFEKQRKQRSDLFVKSIVFFVPLMYRKTSIRQTTYIAVLERSSGGADRRAR